MSDGRTRRKAKQARRDARRRRARERPPDDGSPLLEGVRTLLRMHPLQLLSLASLVISKSTPPELEEHVAAYSGVRARETTALLAILSELLADDDDLAARCREEVTARNDLLPAWIRGLSRVQVRRAARLSDVLGDFDLMVMQGRLVGGKEFTCVVGIDHNRWSWVADVAFMEQSIEEVVERILRPDISVVEMSTADARAWVEEAVEKTPVLREPTWPGWPPLLRWLLRQMPEGGTEYRSPEWEPAAVDDLLQEFFASAGSAPFKGFEYWYQLAELIDTGIGDPLRWSVARVHDALEWSPNFDHYVPVECQLDIPDLLRAFISFAHAKSGIREGLTAEALATVDQMRLAYKRNVLREAGYYDADDEGA